MKTEAASECPVCRSHTRTLLHADLEDEVHHAVKGTFTLWECAQCGAAYLDPRPHPSEIAQAYRGYQTHAVAEDQFTQPATRIGRFRRKARNGYVNLRYEYSVKPASLFGAAIIGSVLPLRFSLDSWVHRLKARPGARLLDVGCGNGGWLAQMRTLGWKTVGVDSDASAVAAARALDLDVREGGIEQVSDERFDAIALNHVIEHVYDPIAMLEACATLLAPGGRMWIATPNLDSLGHRLYGAHWRGIEAPRHLQLFRASTLEATLKAAGLRFEGPLRTRPWARENFRPEDTLHAAWADIAGMLVPTRGEELAYLAFRG